MIDWITDHQNQLMYIGIIIASFFITFLLSNVLYKWIVRFFEKKIEIKVESKLRIIKTIIHWVLILCAITAILAVSFRGAKNNFFMDHLGLIIYLGILACCTVIIASITNVWFKVSTERKIRNEQDITNRKFLRYIVVVAIYFIGLVLGLMAIPTLKSTAQTLIGGTAVIAVVTGVASQEALSNFVGGVFIIIFKPFKVGDVINIGNGMVGTVEDITLRHTMLRNFENKMIVVPNSIINKEKLTNYDIGDAKCCERVEINISYDNDLDLAKSVLQEICESHPLVMDRRSEIDKLNGVPKVKVAVIDFTDSGLIIRAWCWAANFSDSFTIKCDVLEAVKKRFDQEGITIALPYRTLLLKNLEETKKLIHTEDES